MPSVKKGSKTLAKKTFESISKTNDTEVTWRATTNPESDEFEVMVDSIRKSIRKAVDYQKSVNDTDPVTIKKVTGEAIKKILRASKWA